jgi:sodium-dependent dicarboxylate transporter 2/3/5
MTSGAAQLKWIALALGPLLGVVVYLMLPEARLDADGAVAGGLTPGARGTAGVATVMAVWWLTEAIPLSATALLPIALLPLVGAVSIKDATAPYANATIFLFLGGFILGLGMQKWGLHRRIALITISVVGSGPKRVIAGFMIAAALMSMFVSNTATAVMMLPIGVSVIDLVHRRLGDDAGVMAPNFDTCLLLGIAYACSIGGIGTIIGTPPNIALVAFVKDHYGIEISFVGWLKIGIPLVCIFLPIAWVYLTSIAYPIRISHIPGGRDLIRGELESLGRMKRGEWVVFIVFVITAILWITRPWLVSFGEEHELSALASLSDAGIAVGAAIALFLIPVSPRERIFAMDWETATQLPWGILLLFGGGLSLAGAISGTGLDAFLGSGFESLKGVPVVVLIAAVATLVIFLTEMTSNTAVTNTLLPVLAAAAIGLGVPPAMLLVPMALAASCAFMLPVATPPNAIVFGAGHVTLPQMVKAGFWLNLVGIVIVTLLGTTLVPIVAAGVAR